MMRTEYTKEELDNLPMTGIKLTPNRPSQIFPRQCAKITRIGISWMITMTQISRFCS